MASTFGSPPVSQAGQVSSADTRCAVASLAVGEPLLGSAPGAGFLFVEIPLPWPAAIEQAGGYPGGLTRQLAARRIKLVGIAPDPRWSSPDLVRLLAFRPRDLPGGVPLVRQELLVPPAAVPTAVAALLESPVPDRDDGPGGRDLFLCTHGSRDACCGREGVPAYAELGRLAVNTDVRVWRASHLGGHRFAPTLLDLPSGHCWGRLAHPDLAQVLTGEISADLLARTYRGRVSLGPLGQVVEAELFRRHGSAWEGSSLWYSVDADGQSYPGGTEPHGALDQVTVSMSYALGQTGGRRRGLVRATVEHDGETSTDGCGAVIGPVPRYRVSKLTEA